MTRWEHTYVVDVFEYNYELMKEFDRLGSQGGKLVGAVEKGGRTVFWFKRPLPDETTE